MRQAWQLFGLAWLLAALGCEGVLHPGQDVVEDPVEDGRDGDGDGDGDADDDDDTDADDDTDQDETVGDGDGDGDSDGDGDAEGDGDADADGEDDADGDDDADGEDDADDDDADGNGDGEAVPPGDHCAPAAAWDAELAAFEAEVLRLTNEARAVGHDCDSEGNFGPAAPLKMEPHLRCSARLHTAYMAETGDFNHTQTQTGLDPGDRIDMSGYEPRTWGENIAVGQQDPEEVVSGWLDSDGHCSNIMNPDFEDLGVGAAIGPTDWGEGIYWTQNFGAVANW